MKKLIIALCAVATAAIMGCSKDGETGPQGPQGEQGPAGANGTDGTNGTNGNANVKMFMFGPTTFTSTDANEFYNFPLSVTNNMLDSSMIIGYYQLSTASAIWYTASGLGASGSYQTRSYHLNSPSRFSIWIYDTDGSAYSGSSLLFDKIKVIVIPSSDYSGSRYAGVDFNNYEATMKYFGLPLD
ncbi:MAG TPA: hypothetical protein PKC85_09110 [Bacteroidia bacterium]|jgi:hypothetical protein|nr:hypothetical protein [Bacteroidia bacterium]HMU19987.1 hypothetical protein [Bacteroidia bacterium]